MANLSEKELSSLNQLLCDEELLVKKFKMLAEHATDTAIKEKFLSIADKHQKHFDTLYSQLN